MSTEWTTHERRRTYYRSLAHVVYGVPLAIITAAFIYRAFANDWPILGQIGFSVFVLLLGGASTRRACRIGIDIESSGVAVVNLTRTQRLAWDDIESFDIGRDRSLWSSITVTGRDGRRISAEGLRLWGGDRQILTPDLESLRSELAAAKHSASP